MAEKLQVALLQADLKWEDIKQNIQKFEAQIKEVSEEVDLIILPEIDRKSVV